MIINKIGIILSISKGSSLLIFQLPNELVHFLGFFTSWIRIRNTAF